MQVKFTGAVVLKTAIEEAEMLKNVVSICAALIVVASAFSASAQAQHHRGGYYGYHRAGYYGHYGRGWYGGGWAGFAAGAILGGLLAAPYYGRPYYYPYYGSPYYYPGDAVAYCMRRFRSYDPRSGTYLGYDGYRHPCP